MSLLTKIIASSAVFRVRSAADWQHVPEGSFCYQLAANSSEHVGRKTLTGIFLDAHVGPRRSTIGDLGLHQLGQRP